MIDDMTPSMGSIFNKPMDAEHGLFGGRFFRFFVFSFARLLSTTDGQTGAFTVGGSDAF